MIQRLSSSLVKHKGTPLAPQMDTLLGTRDIYVEDYIVAGEVDFTAALQAAVKEAGKAYRADSYSDAQRGGRRVVRTNLGYMRVSGTVIVPQHVIIDLSGCEIVGNTSSSVGVNTIFESGGFKEDGTLESNLTLADNTYRIVGTQIRNIKFRNCIGYHVKNFTEESVIENIEFSDCPQCGIADSSWYGSFRHMTSRQPNTDKVHDAPAFVFSTYVNSQDIEHINVTGRKLAYRFDGAVNGLNLNFVNAEGCTSGMRFTGEVMACKIYGYYEDMTDVAIDMGAAQSKVGIEIDGFFNNVNTAFYGNQIASGELFRSSYFLNVTTKFNTDDQTFTGCTVHTPTIVTAANQVPGYDAGWNLGRAVRREAPAICRDSQGNTMATQTYTPELRELPFSGKEVASAAGLIPFCQQLVTGTARLTVYTRIGYDAHATVLLNLTVQGQRVRGRAYADGVFLDGSVSNMTVEVSNEGGFFAFTFSGNALPANPPLATGVVRII